MQEFGYRNDYRGVFPIKVNQLREVIEEIVDAGEEFHFGLEAGSKPELIAALAMHKDPESLIICNGYKDRAFIRTAMLGRQASASRSSSWSRNSKSSSKPSGSRKRWASSR